MDTLDFLDTKEPEEVVETPMQEAPAEPTETQQPPEPQAEPDQGRARGPDGKFVSKEARPEAPMVPLAALHEVRDELKALKAAQQQQQPAPEAPQVPDMFADPEGYQRYQDERLSQAVYQNTYAMSERFAVMQHGEETVKAAVNWAFQRSQADPHFNAMALSNPDPVGFAIASYQRDQVASQVNMSEFEQFKAWQAAQAEAQQQAEPGQQTATQNPPRSIASMPSSGGATHTPSGPGQAFDQTFRN